MQRLGVEPWSVWRALDQFQDPRWLGYTPAAAKLDNITDWCGRIWQATAAPNSKRRVKTPPLVERPEDNSTQAPSSLDDVGDFFR